MRKVFFSALLAATASGVFAQKLEDVQKSISKENYTQAKEQIDKFLADPANQSNANAWYYKGKIYGELYKRDSANAITYDAGGEAFKAYRKYQELDKKNIMMTLDQNVGYFSLYDANYNKGIKSYNSKNYDEAYQKLKAALEVEEYVNSKGFSYNSFTFPKLDTQLVNLTASSAYLAKKEDEAIPYYTRLADAGLKEPEYKEVYAMLGQYYQTKNDQAKSDKYFGEGRKAYPGDDYWIAYEFGDPGKDNAARFARYDQILKKYPDNYALSMDYASELFNYAYSNDTKPADYTARQQKFEAASSRAIGLKSTALGNFVMSQHIYNQLYDLDDEIRAVKTNTPADQAKRKEITARTNAKYEELYKYSQAAYDLYAAEPNLKAQDKASYRKVTNQLVEYYDRKKDAAKVAFYKEKLAAQK